MSKKEFAGKIIELSDDGYFIDSSQWTEEVAKEMAAAEDLELTEKHIEVLNYIRTKVETGDSLTLRSFKKSGIVDIKGFYKLFPGAPLKQATKFAGVAKPSSCV